MILRKSWDPYIAFYNNAGQEHVPACIGNGNHGPLVPIGKDLFPILGVEFQFPADFIARRDMPKILNDHPADGFNQLLAVIRRDLFAAGIAQRYSVTNSNSPNCSSPMPDE